MFWQIFFNYCHEIDLQKISFSWAFKFRLACYWTASRFLHSVSTRFKYAKVRCNKPSESSLESRYQPSRMIRIFRWFSCTESLNLVKCHESFWNYKFSTWRRSATILHSLVHPEGTFQCIKLLREQRNCNDSVSYEFLNSVIDHCCKFGTTESIDRWMKVRITGRIISIKYIGTRMYRFCRFKFK